MSPLFLFAAVAANPPSLTAHAPSLAENHLAEAQALLAQLEDKKAADTAIEGLKLKPPDPVAARLLLTLGLARFNLLDAEGARRAFAAAAMADPVLSLPDDANPRALSLYGEARAQAKAATVTPPWRYVGAAVAVIGLLALGGGVGFGFSSQAAHTSATNDPSAESAQGWLTVARGRAMVANGLLVAGAVLTLGGGAVTVWPAGGGAALSYQTTF